MTQRFFGLSLQQRLAVVALLLGAVAVFGNPFEGEKVTVSTRELATIVQDEVDHVTVDELADWIMTERFDYRLLDVRDAESYAAYHIPTAENVALTDLQSYGLERNEKIVLYSDGGIHAAQAWFLLRARHYASSYILLGGLDLWKDEILFPAAPEGTPVSEARELEARSHYFGGKLRTGGVEDAPAMEMPEVEAPAALQVKPRKKKSKEGC